MTRTIDDGAPYIKDPSDKPVIVFDWGTEHLPTGVAIASTSFAVTTVQAGDSAGTVLSYDNHAIMTASPYNSRSTRLRLLNGAVGAVYRVANTVVTDESPAQTFERSFTVLIENQ